jgi:hypothetical protein
MLKIISRCAMALAVLATGLVLTPTSASAALTYCERGLRGPQQGPYPASWAYCQYGSGSVRAWIECYSDVGRLVRYYGPWVLATQTSIAYCNSQFYILGSYGLQTQG